MKQDSLLSIILLSYHSGRRIIDVYLKVEELLKKEGIIFEFIIMDDGSKDDSFKIAKRLESEFTNVRAFQLSRNYTSDYSVLAGYSVAKGNCVVMIVDDGQPDEKYIIDLYNAWKEGSKIIFLLRSKRNDPRLSKFFSNTFYKIMDYLADIKYPPGGIEIALVDEEIVEIINSKIHPINTSIFTELIRLGFDPKYIYYERPQSLRKKSRWTFKKKLRLAKNVFFSSSSFPIRAINYMGILFSLMSFLLILFYTYLKIFGNKDFWGYSIPGWTSIILFISFFSGLILLSLGVMAEYIWRIYEEVKNRPGYIIKKNYND
jgi:dolichol-phosphate mannosyltransferase